MIEMLTRIISGVIGAILVIAVILFNSSFPIMLNIIISLASALSTWEMFNAVGMGKNYKFFVPSILFTGISPLIQNQFYDQILWYIYTLIIFCIMILFSSKIVIKDVIVSYSLTALITWSLSCLIKLRNFGGVYGGFFVLLAFGAAWFTDTGAYFCGVIFGKHKLCETISPKKTIEGFWGGSVFCVLFLNLTALIFENCVFIRDVSVNYFYVTIIALFGSVISMIGDLSFSLLKRGYNIKDFGSAIPGHGGILDRFDSVIFVAPFVYFAFKILPIIF